MEIQLSIKGRPLRTFALSKGSLVAGRDPEADIFLDNPGVSRQHAKFEKTAEGFFVEDLASANGTFVNDQPIRRTLLKNRDVVRVGKFSLWVSILADRRANDGMEQRQVSPMAFQGTTVLKTDEIAHILDASKKNEQESPFMEVVQSTGEQQPEGSARPAQSRSTSLIFPMIVALLVGLIAGAVAIWLFLQ
jgi:pSer/pThr/pTyr-binding forkhead associated (FHA) protein